jgi:hypothetical protein
MDDRVSHRVARSAGFHRLVATLRADAVAAGVAVEDYAALLEYLSTHPLLGARGTVGVRRHARVICYVSPVILEQWSLRIARNDLLLLAGMPMAQQLREYQGMAGICSALANRARTGESTRAYARQALAQMQVGLSTSEIRELLELLAHTDTAAIVAALKEENHAG